MASLNRVTIIGNLGRNPEMRVMPNGDAVANVAIATTDSWKDKATGEKREATEWHRIVFYRKLAEIVGKYLKKGSSIYLEGRLHTRKWTDKDGVERYTTEIIADSIKMLGGRGSGNDRDEVAQGECGEGGTSAQENEIASQDDAWLADYDRQMAAEAAAEANKPTPPRRNKT